MGVKGCAIHLSFSSGNGVLNAYKPPKSTRTQGGDTIADYITADTKLPARKALRDEIEQLVSKKSGLYNTYHEQKQRYAELQTVKRNIDQILRREEPRRRKEQSHER